MTHDLNLKAAINLSNSAVLGFPHHEQIVSTDDLEKFTGLTKRFWEARRISGDTPPFIRLSARAIRYKWGDVTKWLEERMRRSTSDNGEV